VPEPPKPAEPQPAPEPELPPAAAAPPPPPPAPEPPKAAPPAPPKPAGTVRVMVRLRSGELLEAGAYDDPTPARARAKELVQEVQDEDNWPFVAGRSISPDEIDTIFLERS
jgi:hypothetical protein